MVSALAGQPRRKLLLLLIGLVGSAVALVSLFFLPVGIPWMGGMHPPSTAWNSGQASATAFVLVTVIPACAVSTFFIGCAALVRPLRRLWVHLFTIAMLVGLVALGLLLCALSFAVQPQLGYWGMAVGYIGILIGRGGFPARPRA